MADLAVKAALVLFEVLEEIASHLDNKLEKWKNVLGDLNQIKPVLSIMQAYITDNEGKKENEGAKVTVNELRKLAHEIEDVLDEYMLHVPRQFHKHNRFLEKAKTSVHKLTHANSLDEIISRVKCIKEKVDRVTPLIRISSGATVSEEGSSSGSRIGPRLTSHALGNKEMVGYGKYREEIVCQVKGNESRCLTIVVAGPAGSGKSFLVKNVAYESIEIRRRFDCYAWVEVTRSFNFERLLFNMLEQFCASRTDPIPCVGVDTQGKLKHYLQEKSYMVVLDDVWRDEDYNRIKNALTPGLFSRIIVTTRNSNLASTSCDFFHCLFGLPSPEDWELFCKKAFGTSNGTCPREMEGCSKKIVNKLDGLPLAIVEIGGLLLKRQHIPRDWEKLLDDYLGSSVSRILLPSYNDLPSNLKRCFLYLSNFPEGYSINRGRLIRLWVAERFVKQTRNKTLEEVAEDYLKELVARNLVHVTKWDLDGRVMSCRVQNLFLEFIVHKSEEENFVSVIGKSNTSWDGEVRGLSIQDDCNALSQDRRSFATVRSTFLFMGNKPSSTTVEDILPLGDFKLLKVLDLEGTSLENFPEGILHLTLLRYLSFKDTKIKTIPNSIKKFSYLETLDLRQTFVTELPKKILRLYNLRHLLVYRYNVANYITYESVQGMEMFRGIDELKNLQKLSLLKVDKHGRIIKELGALAQLRKLGLINLKRKHGKDLCASIQKMKNLTTFNVRSISKEEYVDLESISNPPLHLQRLYLKGRLQRLPRWISSLDNLLRISLWWSKLKDNPLRILQGLPNLMVLYMVDAYNGSELEFAAGRFRKLKILHIEEFDKLRTLLIQEGAMPELQKLSLSKCEHLKMIPLGINYLHEVKELLLYDMHGSFIAQLQKSHNNREMVSHIPNIHSYTVSHSGGWVHQNLS